MKYQGVASNGETVEFHDPKRWLYLFGLIVPIIGIGSMVAYLTIEPALWLLAVSALIYFIGIPFLDLVVGGDTSNPPEAVVPAMSADKHYDYIAYAMIPGHFILFGLGVYIVGTQDLPIWAYLVLLLGVGSLNGNSLTLAHEIGHKTDKLNRFFAKVALSLSGYGHFTIEHNAGHHVWVATPEDCASSKMGETVFGFALRELPGAFVGGWKLEARRLKAQGLPLFHWKNDILQVYAATALIAIVLVAWLGWIVFPFILVHHFLVWYALTQANYIEHYGLLRQKKANGKYERCQPRHSWNTNHRISNLFSLHLQRHSDHHAYPQRPYQALRDYDDVPVLPSGYPGSMALANIPPLWFAVMDPRVIEWADGDIDAIHITDKKRAQLEKALASPAE